MQYPNIAQPQYGFAPSPMPMMAKGGLASLAETVQSAGRNGDTMLAHITPEEAGILKLLGGSGTINPQTGLPEFFSLSSLNPVKIVKGAAKGVGKVFKGVAKAAAPILNKIAPILPFLPIPGIGPLSSLLTKSLLTGIASGLDKSGKFNLKRGLTAGALSYGIGSLMQGAQAAQGANAAGTGGPYDISDVGSLGDLNVPTQAVYGPPSVVDAANAAMSAGDIGYVPPPSAPSASIGGIDEMAVAGGQGATNIGVSPTQAPIVQSSTPVPGVGANAPEPTMASGLGSLAEAAGERALQAITPTSAMDALKMASTGATAYGSIKSLQELEAQKKEAERILREQEKAKAEDIAWANSVLEKYPLEYTRLTAEDVKGEGYAAGRYLRGPGDGTSDSIAASINGKQPARLADGEFVIDARTVSEIGNGSSNAGAKKLYQMMDRVHQARRKADRGEASKADRYLPA